MGCCLADQAWSASIFGMCAGLILKWHKQIGLQWNMTYIYLTISYRSCKSWFCWSVQLTPALLAHLCLFYTCFVFVYCFFLLVLALHFRIISETPSKGGSCPQLFSSCFIECCVCCSQIPVLHISRFCQRTAHTTLSCICNENSRGTE